MNDERLDELLAKARDAYRVPPDAPVDEMWAAIEAEAWPAARAASESSTRAMPPRRDWRFAGLAAAAALAVGFGAGRITTPVSSTPAAVAVAPRRDSVHLASLGQPLQRATTDYLGETAALLRQLSQGDAKGAYTAQATTLLATTRLLLDSPATSDDRLHDLLEDLELILAQIATLPSGGGNARREDLQMIRSALADRDVVPRVHTAVVTLASFDD